MQLPTRTPNAWETHEYEVEGNQYFINVLKLPGRTGCCVELEKVHRDGGRFFLLTKVEIKGVAPSTPPEILADMIEDVKGSNLVSDCLRKASYV